jgi:cryptochrome 1
MPPFHAVPLRRYSRYLSFHFPFTHERSLLEHLRAVPWRFDQHLFKAWRQGRTGYPLVDAAMREVWSTGWMHNRMRVVAASFMVKNLLLPWQVSGRRRSGGGGRVLVPV